jgi:hypothetical protein
MPHPSLDLGNVSIGLTEGACLYGRIVKELRAPCLIKN